MNGKAYKKAIKAIGLSQIKAAVFLGFSARQSRRIAGGTAELSLAAEKLLRVMTHLGLDPKMVNDAMSKRAAPAKKDATATPPAA